MLLFRCWSRATVSGLLYECFVTGYGEELLAPRPTPKLEDQPLSVVRYCLFNIFAATLHIGGRSSTHYLRTRHAVVTAIHSSWSEQAITYSNPALVRHSLCCCIGSWVLPYEFSVQLVSMCRAVGFHICNSIVRLRYKCVNFISLLCLTVRVTVDRWAEKHCQLS